MARTKAWTAFNICLSALSSSSCDWNKPQVCWDRRERLQRDFLKLGLFLLLVLRASFSHRIILPSAREGAEVLTKTLMAFELSCRPLRNPYKPLCLSPQSSFASPWSNYQIACQFNRQKNIFAELTVNNLLRLLLFSFFWMLYRLRTLETQQIIKWAPRLPHLSEKSYITDAKNTFAV